MWKTATTPCWRAKRREIFYLVEELLLGMKMISSCKATILHVSQKEQFKKLFSEQVLELGTGWQVCVAKWRRWGGIGRHSWQ